MTTPASIARPAKREVLPDDPLAGVVLHPDAPLLDASTGPPSTSLEAGFPPSAFPATHSTQATWLEHAPLPPSVHKLVTVQVDG